MTEKVQLSHSTHFGPQMMGTTSLQLGFVGLNSNKAKIPVWDIEFPPWDMERDPLGSSGLALSNSLYFDQNVHEQHLTQGWGIQPATCNVL